MNCASFCYYLILIPFLSSPLWLPDPDDIVTQQEHGIQNRFSSLGISKVIFKCTTRGRIWQDRNSRSAQRAWQYISSFFNLPSRFCYLSP
jgi:hypothetical protein